MSKTVTMANPAEKSTFFQKITKNPLDKKTIRNFLHEMKAYFRVAYMEPERFTAVIFKDFVPEDQRQAFEGDATPFNFSMSAFEWLEITYPEKTNKTNENGRETSETDENGRVNSQMVIDAVMNYLEWSEHQALMALVKEKKLNLLDNDAKSYYKANQNVTVYNTLQKSCYFNAFKKAVEEALGDDFEDSLWAQYDTTEQAISNAADIVNISASLSTSIDNLTEGLTLNKKTLGKILKHARGDSTIELDKDSAEQEEENIIKALLQLCTDGAKGLYKALNRVDKHLIDYGDRHFKAFGFGYLANQVLYIYNYLHNAYIQWQEDRAAKKAAKLEGTATQPLLQ